MPTYPYQWFQIAGCTLAAYLMFRGSCLVIHNACCFILIKMGFAEEKKQDPDA